MTRPAFMAFGGPLAGAWFPLDDGPVTFAAAEPVAAGSVVALGPAGPFAPAPVMHRYELARYGFRDWRDNTDATFVCWLYAPDRAELERQIGATVTYVCVCGCHRDPWPFPCAEAPELEHMIEIPSV